jgi:hypothetical protein
MYRYNLGNNVWEPLFYNAEESRNYAAADYVQYDAFTEEELEDKKNYNFRNALRVTSYDINMQLYPDLSVLRDKPVAIIRSKRAANYQNGAFVISANIGENSLGNYDEFSMYVRLKVGSLYWNGDTWTVNSTAFEVPIDIQGKKIKNTKELDMPYNGADGYIIYRKTGTGSYKKLATVDGKSTVKYLDKSAKKGTTYSYRVYAKYNSYKSSYKSSLSIKDKY